MQWGRQHEAVAVRLFAKHNRQWPALECGIVKHPEFSSIGASPDRLLVHTALPLQWLPLEIKCPYKRALPNSVEEIPLKWLMQVQVQLDCLQADKGVLYLWRPSGAVGFMVYRDDQFAAHYLATVKQFISWVEQPATAPVSRFVKHWVPHSQEAAYGYLYRSVKFLCYHSTGFPQ